MAHFLQLMVAIYDYDKSTGAWLDMQLLLTIVHTYVTITKYFMKLFFIPTYHERTGTSLKNWKI